MTYANFKIRYTAAVLDMLLGLLLFSVLCYWVSSQQTLSSLISAIVGALIILLNPLLLFSSVFFTHFFGGTPGKLLTGLRIATEDGKPLPFKRILFRQTVGYMFSWTFFGLGYYSLIKDEKKQAWHDKAVGSYVTQRGNLLVVGLMLAIIFLSVFFALMTASVKTFANGQVPTEIRQMTKQADESEIREQFRKMQENSRDSNLTWQTYNNNTENVLLQYPHPLIALQSTNSAIVEFMLPDKDSKPLRVLKETNIDTATNKLKQEIGHTGYSILLIKQIKIKASDEVRLVELGYKTGEPVAFYAYIPKSDAETFVIQWYDDDRTMLYQILSTFKFTDRPEYKGIPTPDVILDI